MATSKNNHNKRAGRRGNKDTEYLFHTQRREPSPVHKRDSTTGDTVEEAFLKNVRVFAIVLALMIAFLVIAVVTSKETWNSKHKRMTENLPTEKESPSVAGSHRALEEVKGRDRLPRSTDPDPDTLHKASLLVAQADMLVASSNYEDAVEVYEEALDVWPHHTRVQAELGRLQMRLGNLRDAERVLRRASDTTPSSVSLLNDLGVVYFKQHRLSRAQKAFETALKEDSDYAPALYNLALCHRMNGDRAGAKQMLDRYLALRPGDPHGLKEEAFFVATSGHYAGALEILNQAIASAPDWAPLYFDAAATAALMGDASNAITLLEQAEARSGPFAVYLVYQQPAFADIRSTDEGKAFLGKLVRRAQSTPMKADVGEFRPAGPAPIVSFEMR